MKEVATSFAARLAMCQAAFKASGVAVSDFEAQLPKPSFTVASLKALREQAPNQRLGFLIGEDQLRSFPRWKEPLEILKLATLLVVKRPQGPDEQGTLVQAVATAIEALGPDAKHRIIALEGEVSDAASTEIRRRLLAGDVVPADWLMPEVAEIIKKQRLYAQPF